MRAGLQLKTDICIFIFLYLVCLFLNLIFQLYPDWDWANYKVYDNWSFLNDRFFTDFFAANYRSYFNPLINVPTCILLKSLNNFPLLFFSISVLENAACLFLVYKITNLVFENKSVKFRCLANIFIFAYSITSPSTIYLLGFDRNDAYTACILLFGFYFLLKYILHSNNKLYHKVFLLGLIFGSAIGLKLVSFSYIPAIFLILCVFYKKFKSSFLMLTIYSTGVALPFFLLNGFWMYKLYKYFKNPFFPYFNHIFNSPYADSINLRLLDHGHIKAADLWDYVFYFFRKSTIEHYYGFDDMMSDFRYQIAFITLLFIVILLIYYLIKDKQNNANTGISTSFYGLTSIDNMKAVLLFIIIPLMINTYEFGTYRYIYASFCLFGLIVFITGNILFIKMKYKKSLSAITLIFTLIIAVLFSSFKDFEFVCDSYSQLKEIYKYPIMNFSSKIKFEDGAYVIILNFHSSIAVSEQNDKAHYYGYALPEKYYDEYAENDKVSYGLNIYSKYLQNIIENLILSDEKIYLVYDKENIPEIFLKSLEDFNTKRKIKRKISNIQEIKFMYLGNKHWNFEACEYN